MSPDLEDQVNADTRRANRALSTHLYEADYWPVTSSELADYNRDLRPLLFPLTGHRSIQNAIHAWGIPQSQLIGVNFMGDTLPLDELGIGGFGCELMDNKRNEALRENDKKAGRTVIEGDLDREDTWQKIQDRLDGKKVNLALWRSVSGIVTLPSLPHSIFRQINKAWPLMAESKSLYLAELTASASIGNTHATPVLLPFIEELTDAFNQLPGIQAYSIHREEVHMEDFIEHILFFGYTKDGSPQTELPLDILKQHGPLLKQWIEMSERYVPRASE